MSRAPAAPEALPKPTVEILAPPSWFEPSHEPKLDYEEAAALFAKLTDLSWSGYSVKKLVLEGKLPRYIVMGKLRLSSADVWTCLQGLRGRLGDEVAT